MTLQISETEFRLLRKLIEEQCGILLGDNKEYLIENRLSNLALAHGCKTFGELYFKAKSGVASKSIMAALVDAITTNETSWFRDRHPFRVLKENIFPEFYRQIQKGDRNSIEIWSAGCSTGQEPYSIAMTALDYFRPRLGEREVCRRVRILAMDISSRSLKIAKDGCYDSHLLGRGMPGQYLDRYFTQKNRHWVIKEKVRELISFSRFNLKYPFAGLGPFDVIFLRNVIIYFSDEFKASVVEKLSRVCRCGGYVFLGTGESMGKSLKRFSVLENEGAIYYKKVCN